MRFALSCLLILGCAVSSYAEAQYNFGYPIQNYFRGGFPQPSYEFGDAAQRSPAKLPSADPRFFFTTLTVTLSTSTFTSTNTATFTCTTSTSSLKICTPSGRRRRGISLSDKDARSLFYNDQEEDNKEDNIFLPSPKKVEEPIVIAPSVEIERSVRESPPVPFVVQPGFNAPSEAGSGRFLVAFGTTTTTVTTTTTLTSSLTATCSSTTGYQLCGSTGKK